MAVCPSGGLEEGREQFETVQMTPRPRHSLSENLPIQAKMGWSHFPVNTCDMNKIKARHACTEKKKLSTDIVAWIATYVRGVSCKQITSISTEELFCVVTN